MNNQRPLSHLTRRVWLVTLLLLTAHCLLPTASAQSATATLSGTVEDQNGAVVPGASVTVSNTATSLERRVTTNDQGYFTVPLLPPSTYTVRAEHQGFAPVQIEKVVLNVGDQKALHIQLKAGDINATVQVTNDAPLISQSPAVGTVVDRQFAENIPLNGRSFQTLIELTPGVVVTNAVSAAGNEGQFSVNGQRADSNYFSVDGVSANFGAAASSFLSETAGGSVPAFSVLGTTSSLVSVDAMQEFRVQTSTFAPEYGRTPGAQVSIVTRSGTNALKGTLFEYFRNDVFDASDWFANRQGLKKAALRQNDFGGVFSGPILLPRFGEGGSQPGFNGKNRTFFFFSYEGLRLRLPQTQIATVPSISARQSASPAIQPFLNLYPAPNGTDFGNGTAQFSASFSNQATLNATSIRIDHTLTGKLSLFGRYNYAPSISNKRSLSNVTTTNQRTQTFTVGTVWSLSATATNDFRFNYSRSRANGFAALDTFGGAVVPPASTLFPSPFDYQTAQYLSAIFSARASTIQTGRDADNVQQQINLVDNHSISKGTHALKFGADYRRESLLYRPQAYMSEALFSNVPTLLAGRALIGFVTSNRNSSFFFHDLGLFVQDTWRVVPRLTLTYGLRWDLNSPPSTGGGLQLITLSNVDNPSTITATPSSGSPWKKHYGNFAPRIGVAYQLSQGRGHETVLRGGFGVFYDRATQQVGSLFSSGLPPIGGNRLGFSVPFPFSPAFAAPPQIAFTLPASTVAGYDPNLKQPYALQWNVAVERSLGLAQTVSATYVAAVGRHLLQQQTFLNPNPNFIQVNIVRSTATSDYRALQLQYNRRLAKGLQALASYTWSHSNDTGSASGPGELSNLFASGLDPNQNRGPSSFDIRHSFSAALTYDLPNPLENSLGRAILGGWAIENLFLVRSAPPVDIQSALTTLGVTQLAVRPDIVSGMPLYLFGNQFPGGKAINRAAFIDPPTDSSGNLVRQGNLGRNALRGFGAWQWDFAVRRQFKLSERTNLLFRCELFNLLNHPNFGSPDPFLADGTFGKATAMLGRSLGSGGLNPLYQIGGPRSVQFALKLAF